MKNIIGLELVVTLKSGKELSFITELHQEFSEFLSHLKTAHDMGYGDKLLPFETVSIKPNQIASVQLIRELRESIQA